MNPTSPSFHMVKYEEHLGNAIFVSHQWTGLKHPDPHFRQLSMLQKATGSGWVNDHP
jgi:hypothetical protein